eukprot:6973988-Pyramimonas_sp.AAC.1
MEQVVDARSAGRFNGTAPEPRPKIPSGNIPGRHRGGCYRHIVVDVNSNLTWFVTGPPVQVTPRMHSTPQRPAPFSHPVSTSPPSPTSVHLGPVNIAH